jgi:hypothetical protein
LNTENFILFMFLLTVQVLSYSTFITSDVTDLYQFGFLSFK